MAVYDTYDAASPKPEKKKLSLPKLGLYMSIFLIVAKLIYLVFETYYNGYIIDIVSSTDVTKDSLERLEGFGNNISSVGITLLLLPFYYLITKVYLGYHRGVHALVLIIVTLVTFFGIKQALYTTVDSIIDSNKDKRYESYYIEMFKYGMLTGKLGYSSFIPKENLDNLSVRDKIIISNLFLLTHFDKELIGKFVGIGQEKFFDIYIHKYFKDNYQLSRERLEEFATNIEKDWQFYNNGIQKINKDLAHIESAQIISKEYKAFTNSLKQRYTIYRTDIKNYTKALNKSMESAPEIYGKLKPLFTPDGEVIHRARYEQLSQKYFDKVLDVDVIAPLTPSSVEDALEEKSLNVWNKRTKFLPLNLTQRQFFVHPVIRAEVVKDLRHQGIRVPSNFNYSKKQFANAYIRSLDSLFKAKKIAFQKEFAKRTGHKHIKFGLSHKQFVRLYKNEIMHFYKRKDLNIAMYDMLQKNDLSAFYERIYKPKLRENYYDRAFPAVEDFEVKLSKYGDQAIKMLYIPPFAITVSMIAGMLNFISLLSLILFIGLYKRNELWIVFAKTAFKLAMLITLIVLPYNYGVKHNVLDEYPLLEKFKQTQFAPYISLMNWLLTVESFNYNVFYTSIKNSGILETIMQVDRFIIDPDEVTRNITGLKERNKDIYLEH